MIYINEWLPNPIGNDNCKANCGWNVEFVELANRGSSTVNLSGWSLWTGGKSKKVFLSGTIAPGGFAVFKKAQTKLSLKNSDGGLWLYEPSGALADHASFSGVAPVGQSFSRVDYGVEDTQHFAFLDPTPGTTNASIDTAITIHRYPSGTVLDPSLGPFQVAWLVISFVVVLASAIVYIFYKNENLSQFIFERNPGVR